MNRQELIKSFDFLYKYGELKYEKEWTDKHDESFILLQENLLKLFNPVYKLFNTMDIGCDKDIFPRISYDGKVIELEEVHGQGALFFVTKRSLIKNPESLNDVFVFPLEELIYYAEHGELSRKMDSLLFCLKGLSVQYILVEDIKDEWVFEKKISKRGRELQYAADLLLQNFLLKEEM